MEKQSQNLAGATEYAEGDFSALLKKEFRPQSDDARSAIESAVKTLAEQVLQDANIVSSDALASISAIIASLDKKLTEQINQIIHHSDFQQLEGAWRGLHYLVNNTETDEQLKIRVMNVSKNELGKSLKKFKGTAWDQSPLFKKVYEEEYGQFGGEPYGALVADYQFDPMNSALMGFVKDLIYNAILFYEPRIKVLNLNVNSPDSWDAIEGRLLIEVDYLIINSNSRFNFVFDYYVNESASRIA